MNKFRDWLWVRCLSLRKQNATFCYMDLSTGSTNNCSYLRVNSHPSLRVLPSEYWAQTTRMPGQRLLAWFFHNEGLTLLMRNNVFRCGDVVPPTEHHEHPLGDAHASVFLSLHFHLHDIYISFTSVLFCLPLSFVIPLASGEGVVPPTEACTSPKTLSADEKTP